MDTTTESTAGAQSFQDIENYLANFNKEIANGSQGFILTAADCANDGLYAEPGSIYQSNLLEGSMNGTQLKHLPNNSTACSVTPNINYADGSSPYSIEPQISSSSGIGLGMETAGLVGHVSPHLVSMQTLSGGIHMTGTEKESEMVMSNDGESQISPVAAAGEHSLTDLDAQQQFQSSGTNSFQTVTIVPSDMSQGGEVSYVLIVSQQDDKAEPTGDMSVYDFKDEAKGNHQNLMHEELEEEEEDDDEEQQDEDDSLYKPQPRRQAYRESSSGPSMQLMCNFCNYTSSKRYLLTRHMRAHSEDRPHKCSVCGRAFKTVTSLHNHINTHTGVRPQKCKECSAAFTTSGELVRHVRYRHTFEKPHKCTDCDYASVELSKLKRHIRSHTGERPYACPHCTYASPDTYKLKRHLRIHTGEKPYVCDICQTRFTQSNSLKAHKLIHSGNKPVFQCELCPTTCGRKTDLKFHVLKLHTSDRPLLCKKCGKSFPDRYTYKIHLKTHEGEKCFRCELCPYAALSQRHLENHVLTHTGLKPYQCGECDQTFRQKQLLRRHLNLYHNPDYVAPPPRHRVHECNLCPKRFAHRGNLLRHVSNHYPDNPDYQDVYRNNDASTGEEDEEEETNDGGDNSPEDQFFTEQDQNQTNTIQMAEIDGQQMQVQLVRLQDQEGQVYIQIDGQQMLCGESVSQGGWQHSGDREPGAGKEHKDNH